MIMQDFEAVEIKVLSRASMDRDINAAVDLMIQGSRGQRTHGILVTRLGDGHFVVGFSDTVPFGYTDQLDLRRQPTSRFADTVPGCCPFGAEIIYWKLHLVLSRTTSE
ncbi:hypothetical protein PJL15_04391 [Paenarthrobacter nitroguajacolicus]|nr:hypothetical protein [Paenarthrobacter nitroguajacolicus]